MYGCVCLLDGMIRISSGADCSARWSDSFLEGRMEEKVSLVGFGQRRQGQPLALSLDGRCPLSVACCWRKLPFPTCDPDWSILI